MKEILLKDWLHKLQRLSDVEWFVLTKFSEGLTTKEIANINGRKRSIKTIEAQFFTIKQKLEIPTKHALFFITMQLFFQIKSNKIERTPLRFSKYSEFILKP